MARIPKKVGGVKIRKKLRKPAERVLDLLNSPAARELAMTALALAASKAVSKGSAKAAASRVKDVAPALDELGALLRNAAAEGARRFLEGYSEKAKAPAKAKVPARRPSGAATKRGGRAKKT